MPNPINRKVATAAEEPDEGSTIPAVASRKAKIRNT
jgi:hypothetical protein